MLIHITSCMHVLCSWLASDLIKYNICRMHAHVHGMREQIIILCTYIAVNNSDSQYNSRTTILSISES